jgi:hypothetical protein
VAGDTPLQHYNSLLTLAQLQEHADAVIILSNQACARLALAARWWLSRRARQDVMDALRAGRSRAAATLSFPQINAYMAGALSDMLSPLAPVQVRALRRTLDPRRCTGPRAALLRRPRPQRAVGLSCQGAPAAEGLGRSAVVGAARECRLPCLVLRDAA